MFGLSRPVPGGRAPAWAEMAAGTSLPTAAGGGGGGGGLAASASSALRMAASSVVGGGATSGWASAGLSATAAIRATTTIARDMGRTLHATPDRRKRLSSGLHAPRSDHRRRQPVRGLLPRAERHLHRARRPAEADRAVPAGPRAPADDWTTRDRQEQGGPGGAGSDRVRAEPPAQRLRPAVHREHGADRSGRPDQLQDADGDRPHRALHRRGDAGGHARFPGRGLRRTGHVAALDAEPAERARAEARDQGL